VTKKREVSKKQIKKGKPRKITGGLSRRKTANAMLLGQTYNGVKENGVGRLRLVQSKLGTDSSPGHKEDGSPEKIATWVQNPGGTEVKHKGQLRGYKLTKVGDYGKGLRFKQTTNSGEQGLGKKGSDQGGVKDSGTTGTKEWQRNSRSGRTLVVDTR